LNWRQIKKDLESSVYFSSLINASISLKDFKTIVLSAKGSSNFLFVIGLYIIMVILSKLVSRLAKKYKYLKNIHIYFKARTAWWNLMVLLI
jgi:hypothetical protein